VIVQILLEKEDKFILRVKIFVFDAAALKKRRLRLNFPDVFTL